MDTIAAIIATGIIGSALYMLGDAQTFVRMHRMMGVRKVADEPINELANRDRMATPWGDVCELPAAARNAGEGRRGAATGVAQTDEIAPHLRERF
jgi:hypothetical protein